jgi:hypothetical protein
MTTRATEGAAYGRGPSAGQTSFVKPIPPTAWPTLCTAQPPTPGAGDRLVHKADEVLHYVHQPVIRHDHVTSRCTKLLRYGAESRPTEPTAEADNSCLSLP